MALIWHISLSLALWGIAATISLLYYAYLTSPAIRGKSPGWKWVTIFCVLMFVRELGHLTDVEAISAGRKFAGMLAAISLVVGLVKLQREAAGARKGIR